MSSLSAQEIVNWVTTVDGCVHTLDTHATKQFRRVGITAVYIGQRWRKSYRNAPTLFRTVPSPTPYGLLFLEIGGLQLSYPSYLI